MAPKSRSERGCRCAADIYDGCRNNRADRPLTAFTNCPIKSPLHSGLFHYFPNPRFCRLTSDSQKNDVKKLCQKRCRNFGRNFAAKPPREQSSREGARADARRNAQSSSGGADSSAPNAMRGCDLHPCQCENEGACYIVRDRSARHAKRAQGAPLILRRSRPASKVPARERERTRGGTHNPRAEERNGTLRAEEQTQA